MAASSSTATGFSLADARAIVRDLFVPDERIYWIDFLTTVLVGYACFGLTARLIHVRLEPLWLRLALALLTFSVQCACLYRAALFIHEIVHLPENRFIAFRVVWNLLCGIPMLIPSFTYSTHLGHHRRTMYGTNQDGEYLPLAHMRPWWILIFFTHALWAPPVAVIRFGILTPLTWFIPSLRRLVHQRASSLVIDPSYLRPLPTTTELRSIRLQEFGCFVFLFAWVIVPPVLLHRSPVPFIVQGYLSGVVGVFLNAVRTLASHHWTSDGHEGTFIDQMLDSVTMDNDSPLAVLINPVGLRFHSTHHLFPSMPYHNIRAAHKRLMDQLPADSLYRLTVARSVWSVIGNVWRQAAEHNRRS